MVALKDTCTAMVVKSMLVIVAVAGVGLSWWALWREFPKVRDGVLARRIDSYLPMLSDLGPDSFKTPKEGSRFLAYYQLIEREAPATKGLLEVLGYCYYYSGDSVKAINYFEKAMRSNAHSFVAMYNLGVIYYRKNDYEKAEKYFQQAVSLVDMSVFNYVMGSKIFSQFRIAKGLTPFDVMGLIRHQARDAKRYIKLCIEKQGRERELIFLAIRYNDLIPVWSENGGQPTTMDLIIF